MDVEALQQHREERDRFLAEHYASPLPEEHQGGFSGLEYFAPAPEWVVGCRYEPVGEREIAIPSSAGTESPYTMVGEAILAIGGREYRLAVLDDGDGGRFIPFRDTTAGDTTYGGGRYAGIEVGDDGAAVVDFNRASNPWCVYDAEFVCPLPPLSNVIDKPIIAGERMWRSDG